MLFYSATTAVVLLLHHRTTAAFQCATPINTSSSVRHHQHDDDEKATTAHQRSKPPPLSSFLLFSATMDSSDSMTTTSSSLESILDDGNGHINPALASAIYEWERAHTQLLVTNAKNKSEKNKGGPKKEEFSTRDGLRLVDRLAREVLDSLESNTNNTDDDDSDSGSSEGTTKKSAISYNDLVQEGMIALLRAMSTYTNYISLGSNNTKNSNKNNYNKSKITTFEQYAKEIIHSTFLQYLATSSRPIRLPASLQTTLNSANVAAQKLRTKLGKEPTLVQVAQQINVNPEQLAFYRKLYRKMMVDVGGQRGGIGGGGSTFVSMEDGMEVYDPSLAGYTVGSTGLRPRSDLDTIVSSDDSTSIVSASSSSTSAKSNDMDNDDIPNSTLFQLNTQEDDWTRQPPERSVAPMRDVFTDTEELNNPLDYTHHFILNEELNHFLMETLTNIELEVIQLRFGLVDSKYGGRGWSAHDIGERVGMEYEEVVKVASVALEKLRQAAAADDDAFVEVSL